MSMYYQYHNPDEHDDNEMPEGASHQASGNPFDKKPNKKMPFFKKLGLTAALAATAGLVGGGVFTGVTSLASSGAKIGTAVQEEAAAEDNDDVRGVIPGPDGDKDGEKEGTDRPTLPGNQAQNTIISGQDDVAPSTLENDEKIQHDGQVLSVSLTGSAMSTSDIASAVMPAMVAITNTSVQEVQDYFGGMYGSMFGFGGNGSFPQEIESTAMGTGVIIDQDDEYLYIVTNQHVVENAKELSAAFADETAAEAEVVGEDASDDLAVIRVALSDLSEETLQAIRVASMGSSDELTVGQDVIAIGNALGYGQSVSVGIVSALNRSMDGGEGVYADGLIQTDAAINPGNSGGALLDSEGKLIGINSAKYASTEIEGMGYAIPIDTAYPIIRAMIDGTYSEDIGQDDIFWNDGGQDDIFGNNGGQDGGTEVASGACLGITCTGISEQYASYYDIPQGIYVSEVVSGGPADKAGLEAGDIILSFDGENVTTVDSLTAILNNHEPGDTVSIKIARASSQRGGYRTGETEVTLGSRSDI